MSRLTKDEYYMGLALMAAARSTCLSRRVGAVIVDNDGVVSTGYNGPPRGLPHCEDLGGCQRKLAKSGDDLNACRAVHAELNAIIQASRIGVPVRNATMYCTYSPCKNCMAAIINSGIFIVYYMKKYADFSISYKMAEEAGVTLAQLSISLINEIRRVDPWELDTGGGK